MGGFVDFECRHCNYEEADIAYGRGRGASPYLALCRCEACKTVNSTWVYENQPPRCGVCYDERITILPDDTRRLPCPKCGEPAMLVPKEGSWE